MHANKIENNIKFKIKTGCNLKHLTIETMKLPGSTEKKLIKDKNRENVPHLKNT